MSKILKKRSLRSILEGHDENLPIHPSDASNQVPDKFVKEEDEDQANLKEYADSDLPTHGSDAASEVPDSLSGKLGKRSVKAEVDGDAIAKASGNKITKTGVQLPESEEDELKEDEEKKPFWEEDEELKEGEDEDLKEDEEKKAFWEEDEELKEEDEEKKEVSEEDEELKEEDEEKKEVSEEDEELKEEDEESEEEKAKKKLSEEEEEKLKEEEEKKLEEEEKEEIKEHLSALVRGEVLPNSFKKKAATLFEAALKSCVERRLAVEKRKLQEKFEKKVKQKTGIISESIVNKVDQYLDYVVSEWLVENKVAIESSLRTQISEKFINGLKTLFVESYVSVPESKVNAFEKQAQKAAKLEKQLNEEINRGISLKQKIAELSKKDLVSKLSKGLTAVEASKFAKLSERVSFEDESQFENKLQLIKESYFPKTKIVKRSDSTLIVEGGLSRKEELSAEVDPVAAEAANRLTSILGK